MPLDFADDSPAFRKRLVAVEENVRSLLTYSERIFAGSRRYVHYAYKFKDAHVGFASSLATASGEGEPVLIPSIGLALGKVSATLRDLHDLSHDAYALTEQSLGRVQQSNEDELRRVNFEGFVKGLVTLA